jgi:hypothetical protein
MQVPQSKTKKSPAPTKKKASPRKPKRPKPPKGMTLLQQSSDHLRRNFYRYIKRFPGEYVIVLGYRLIAHGYDLEEVSREADRKAGEDLTSALQDWIPESNEDYIWYRY